MKKNGIRHKTSAPYHPATNGLAERAVQVVKNGLRKNREGDFDLRLTRALYRYRFTPPPPPPAPPTTTGASPSELFLGRKLKTHMDLITPDLSEKVLEKQKAQRAGHDRKVVERTYREGDTVYARNYQSGDKWLRGKIANVLGTRTYMVELETGVSVKRHVNQLRNRPVTEQSRGEVELECPVPESNQVTPPSNSVNPLPPSNRVNPTSDSIAVRRSTRNRHPPSRYTQERSSY